MTARAMTGAVVRAALHAGALAAALSGCLKPAPLPLAPRLAACPHVPPPPRGGMAAPPAPASGFRQILRPGHWEWDERGYIWSPPVWMTLLEPGAPYWRDGAWVGNRGACVWNRGHFVLPGAAPGPAG